MTHLSRGVIFLTLLATCFTGDRARAADGKSPGATGPLAPADAKASFELEPGLAVELVAAEPLVASPCAVAWDERGRMYVAENRGYPLGGPNGKRAGVVAVLEDTNVDGLPDKRTDFATGLGFPNGVMPWRGGVIVTDAPDVVYLKDTDADGKADVREVLLTGFSTSGSTQLRVNKPTLGPDGWVYLAGGLVGGKVHSPKHPDKVLDTGKNDVKFRPDTGEIQLVDGKGQYGLTFDDAGHRFVCYNRVQVQHAPLPARYLARNPDVISPGVLQSCPDLVKNLMLGLPNDAGAKTFPISSNIVTADSHSGTYSAACAVHVARGDRIPQEYAGKAWSCDPTGNLVRYDALDPVGGTFHARRVRDNVEAFRSRDDWFRPVFLADGPDGTLYVVDMYRKTIEHPEYLPDEVRKNTDFDSGKDMGRIWRLLHTEVKPVDLHRTVRWHDLMFGGTSDETLVTALTSSNGWTRDTAFRLITERRVAQLKHKLAALAASAEAPSAAVICALNLLANAGELPDELVLAASKHRSPDVRENAVRLAEPRLGDSPALADRVIALAGDDHVHVRYAATLALGEIVRPDARNPPAEAKSRVAAALAGLAAREAEDKWFCAAILTSAASRDVRWQLLRHVAGRNDAAPSSGQTTAGTLAMLHDLTRLYVLDNLKSDPAGGAKGALESVWEIASEGRFDARAAVLVGATTGTPAEVGAALRNAVAAQPGGELAHTLAEAGRVSADAAAPPASRRRAIQLLAVAGDEASESALLALVAPEQPADIAIAAIRALAQPHRKQAVAKLLEPARWNRFSPALRTTVLTTMVGRPEFATPLVDAVESGAVPASALNEPQRKWLASAGDDALKARAAKLLAGGTSEDRKKAFEDAKAVLGLKPDPAKGQRAFMAHCSSCHRLEREGYAVGPDLYSIRSQPKESILLHIVIPEQEVAPNFAAYDCVTTDGRTITGIMTAETPSSVTLKQVLGLEETLPREKIKSLTASKASLMPQGLEKAMKPQELADLLAYLRGEK